MEKVNKIRIKLIDVSKSYETESMQVHALQKMSLDVMDGEFLCLVGPSGCGKSTLLNLIAGLDKPDTGQIFDGDEEVKGPGNDRVVMFQESALFPWLSVIDNVLFGLKLKKGLNSFERVEIAHHFLEMVGLERYAKSYIHELSGGMRQRVALARSLAPNPHVLLMDEPFAALDAITREQLYLDLQNIWERAHKTIIFVTHNVSEAASLGDRILVFSKAPGLIVAEHMIHLKRPRDIRSIEIAEVASKVTKDLRKVLNHKV